MKTAISLPDGIFEEAERFARERGMSRSELYASAIAAYLKAERFLGTRARLDAVYGRGAAAAEFPPLPGEDW